MKTVRISMRETAESNIQSTCANQEIRGQESKQHLNKKRMLKSNLSAMSVAKRTKYRQRKIKRGYFLMIEARREYYKIYQIS